MNYAVWGAVTVNFFLIIIVFLMAFEVTGFLQLAGFLAGSAMVVLTSARIAMLLGKKE